MTSERAAPALADSEYVGAATPPPHSHCSRRRQQHARAGRSPSPSLPIGPVRTTARCCSSACCVEGMKVGASRVGTCWPSCCAPPTCFLAPAWPLTSLQGLCARTLARPTPHPRQPTQAGQTARGRKPLAPPLSLSQSPLSLLSSPLLSNLPRPQLDRHNLRFSWRQLPSVPRWPSPRTRRPCTAR